MIHKNNAIHTVDLRYLELLLLLLLYRIIWIPLLPKRRRRLWAIQSIIIIPIDMWNIGDNIFFIMPFWILFEFCNSHDLFEFTMRMSCVNLN